MRSDSQGREVTAYHEAGHAVIGRVLTLPCGYATIKPDYKSGSWGISICPNPDVCDNEWQKGGKVRPIDAVWIARIIYLMAGADATRECTRRVGGDEDDRLQIALMLDEAPAYLRKREARLRAITRMLIRRHKALIERVAKALLAKETVSAAELDKLVGRSVADIKPNKFRTD